MTKPLECPSCYKKIERDSAFCRYCGRTIPKAAPLDRRATLARTGDFSSLDDAGAALEAVNDYQARWPDGPDIRDVLFTRQCLGFLFQLDNLPVPDLPYEDQAELASAVAEGLPLILSNGLATAGCLPHPDKVQRFLTWMADAHNKCAVMLDAVHKNAEQEAQSLLVKGKSRAAIRDLGNDYFFKEAQVHYAAFTAGNLDAALSGFTALKELNPHDGYVRNMLGSILFKQGKHLHALQQFLYGFALYPKDVDLVRNTMRCLCGLMVYPAVIEIWRHYTQVGGNPDEPSIRPWFALARACCAATCAKATQCVPGDFSENAPDLIDEVAFPDHPWMPAYLFDVEAVVGKARLFISYRRTGGGDHARRVEAALRKEYPSMHVFRDETSMMAGQDFTRQLQDEIDAADVFLALIDPDWTGAGQKKKSRLLDPKDVLRREIARALQRSETVVIPVLLERARMPAEREFPDELVPFSRLHAVTLSETSLDHDLRHLLGEVAKLFSSRMLRKTARTKRLQRLEALENIDPAAARKEHDELFGAAVDELPRFFQEKSVGGKGVPFGKVKWEGVWECTATAPAWQASLRFETERSAGSPFVGEFAISGGAPQTREEIRGGWLVVLDLERKLLLGMILDGVKSGTVFKLRIPFDRQSGNDLIGTDSQGVTYVSRNLGASRVNAF